MSTEHLHSPESQTDHLSLYEQAAIIAGEGVRINTLASVLDHQEVILHVGTSLAEAGDEITSMRGDAHWINVDPSYENCEVRYNYEFIQAGIDQLAEHEHIKEGEFNRIVSYGLTDSDSVKAQEIADKLYKYLKPGGKLKVGPISKHEWKLTLTSRMLTIIKPQVQDMAPIEEPRIASRKDRNTGNGTTTNPYVELVKKNIELVKDMGHAALFVPSLFFKK